jgi:glycosyltransferase involved in cell wall biosynthesis
VPERRIGHVVNTMGGGGVASVAYALLERLPRTDARTLYCLSRRCPDPAAQERQLTRLAAAGVRVRFADVRGAAAAAEQVAGWTAEDGLHLVHTHSTKPNRYVRAAVLRRGGPRVVAHFHNTYDDKWADPEVLRAERELAGRTDRLLACSGAVRDHLVERLGVAPLHVQVVRNGVELDRYRGGDGARLRAELGLGPRTPLVGTVGRVSRQKAPEDLVRAARLVLDAVPDAVVVHVGAVDDEPVAAQASALAAQLGLGDRLRFLGHRPDLADVYAALDVFLLPSRWEGFGLVLVEAMAAGTPVVATQVGGVPEVVGEAAVLEPPGRPDLMAASVVRLLRSPQEAAALVRRGTVQAERLGWAEPAACLDRLYDELLQPVGCP